MAKGQQVVGSLERVKELTQDRGRRARELKNEGQNILGYFCSYFPIEFLTAANIVPYRLMGNLRDPVTVANTYVDPAVCPYIKSCFDMAMKGGYDFIDGWVTPDTCDNMVNIYRVWNYNLPLSYTYWLNVPNFLDEECFTFFKRELAFFRRSVGKFAQCEITDERLHRAIDLHNEQRGLMRELDELKKPEPPLLKGSEMLLALRAAMSLPVEEANELLRGVIADVKERRDRPERSRCRLIIWGPEIDDPALYELIEGLGANVVTDSTCIGTKFFSHGVKKTDDPLDGLSNHYLGDVYCPRTIRGKGEGWSTYQQDMDERFGHILEFARDFSVDGVILYVMKFCDLHEFDAPDLRDYLEKESLPVLHVETDYSMAAIGALKTRIEAFLEMTP